MARTWARQPVDRPPFVPGIYEHKAAILGVPVTRLATDRQLLVDGLAAELDRYRADAVVAGVDIYNVEAEALGVAVERTDDPQACPGLGGPILPLETDWDTRALPDPRSAGRMPLFAAACAEAHARLGAHVVVRGALTGPWTLASALVDQTDLLCALKAEPDAVLRLLGYCARITTAYGRALCAGGAALAVFDSRLAPPLVPPRVLETWLPLYQRLFADLAAASGRPVALIVGGNTGPVAPLLARIGAGELLCDAPAPLEPWLDTAATHGRCLRVNCSRDDLDRPAAAIARIAAANHGRPGLVVGTGALSCADDPTRLTALRSALITHPWETA